MKNNNTVLLYIILILVAGMFVYITISPKQVTTSSIVNTENSYVQPTSDIDFSPEIVAVAAELKASSTSTIDLIKKTITYTKDHVTYKGDITVNQCYTEKASDTLRTGEGDCVSMSRLNVALFRANGIPSRTLGGCLTFNRECTIFFALVPGEQVPVSNITGDRKKRGYLHEWVEVYDGQKWLSIESTTGNIFETGCERYYFYGYDSTPQDRCVIDNYNFVSECDTR